MQTAPNRFACLTLGFIVLATGLTALAHDPTLTHDSTLPFDIDAAPTRINCDTPAEVYWINDGHLKMVEVLKQTLKHIETEADPKSQALLTAGFEKYFKSSLGTPEWETVKQTIKRVAAGIGQSVYQCSSSKKVFLCSISGAPALTPPGKDKVNLCPKTFSLRVPVSAVLLHEAMHRFGGSEMDYMSEVYCYDWEKKNIQTPRLIKTPDAYMLFIHYVGQGGASVSYTCHLNALRGQITR